MKKLLLVLVMLIGVSSLMSFKVIEDNTIKTEKNLEIENDSHSIEISENLNCSELTFKNTGYQTKNVYVYGKKLGEERWLAASFGLGAGNSTSLDTSDAGYMVQWEVEVDGMEVSGYGCEYNI